MCLTCKESSRFCTTCLALIQAIFHVGDRFWAQENWYSKSYIANFFQDKFYSLKVHAHYFTVLMYLATWRAPKLGIFTHFTFTNSPRCSQSINTLIYVYSMQIPSCFLWVPDHSLDRTSLYYCHPKNFTVLPTACKDQR